MRVVYVVIRVRLLSSGKGLTSLRTELFVLAVNPLVLVIIVVDQILLVQDYLGWQLNGRIFLVLGVLVGGKNLDLLISIMAVA